MHKPRLALCDRSFIHRFSRQALALIVTVSDHCLLFVKLTKSNHVVFDIIQVCLQGVSTSQAQTSLQVIYSLCYDVIELHILHWVDFLKKICELI